MIPCPLKTDAEFAAAANDHTDWSIDLFRCGKNQGAGNDTRSAGQRFLFDAALVCSHENFLRAALLDKIHIRPSRRKHFVTPDRFASPANIDIVDFENRYHHVRHATVDKMHAFFLRIGNKFDPKSQVFRVGQLESDQFAAQFSPNQAGRRLK